MLFVSSRLPAGQASLIDIRSGVAHRAYRCAPCAATHAACASAGGSILVGQEHNSVFAFCSSMSQPLRKSIVAEKMTAMHESPCGNFVVGGAESGCIYLWASATGQLLSVTKGQLRTITCVVSNPSGSLIASASEDSTCRIYSLGDLAQPSANARPVCLITSHTLAVTDAAFFNAAQSVVTCSLDRSCRISSARTGQSLMVFRLDVKLRSVALRSDDSAIAVGGDEGSVTFIDPVSTATFGAPTTVAVGGKAEDSPVLFSSFLETGELVTVAENSVVQLWSGNQLLREVSRPKGKLPKLGCVTILPNVTAATSRVHQQLRKYPLSKDDTVVLPVGAPDKVSTEKGASKPMGRRERKRLRQGGGYTVDVAEATVDPAVEALERKEHRMEGLRQDNARLLALANDLFAQVQVMSA